MSPRLAARLCPVSNKHPRPIDAWMSSRVFRAAAVEYRGCLTETLRRCARGIRVPPRTPRDFCVRPSPFPRLWLDVRRNLFSSLFHSTYLLLDIPPARRHLYGCINHLFRIWVTATDNLLDGENKPVVPLDMRGKSIILPQVISIMAADRALAQLLEDAIARRVITRAAADRILTGTLSVLLPSAAQEAGEEAGITHRPAPAYVREVIHRLKTGLLFQVPFLGIDRLEVGLPVRRVREIKAALLEFGVACQILDDVRDLARDLRQKRHNYVLSILQRDAPRLLSRLAKTSTSLDARLYQQLPDLVAGPCAESRAQLCASLAVLSRNGLDLSPDAITQAADGMFTLLDLEDLSHG